MDIFRDPDLHNEEYQEGKFRFGSEDFQLRTVFNYYFQKVSSILAHFLKQNRYPCQGFLELYLHDAMQEFAKSRDEMQRVTLKAKKIA